MYSVICIPFFSAYFLNHHLDINVAMDKTTFKISKMDCPSEENLIRMKLESHSNIEHLEFDIPNRQLTVFHHDNIEGIETAIHDLKLGDTLLSTETIDPSDPNNNFKIDADSSHKKDAEQRKLLWIVLVINFAFFIIEMSTGLISRSMGLVADSLDMLADSFVYGISLFAVGGTVIKKKRIARIAGYFQITLAILGFLEVLRRFFGNKQLPDFSTMIVISILALIANSICIYLLQKSKSKEEAHMQASMIFTSNDVIINLGIIVSGILVNWLHSSTPDLIIGSIVFALVIQGAFRILKLSK